MKHDIWSHLAEGRVLPKIGMEQIDGRIDLRNLHLAEPRTARTKQTALADITPLEGVTQIRGAKWQSIDFASSHLPALRLYYCNIDNCIFDECALRDLRAWGTNFSNVSFRSADLRSAVLGGVLEGKKNVFKNVDFSFADLSRTVYVAADFFGCQFKNTKLEKVDFQSSVFEDCAFEGQVREVIFYSRSFKGEGFPKNKMKNIDFSRAKLRWVEFRGLDLENVRFPDDNEHILVEDFPKSLERLITFFQTRSDPGSKKLTAVLVNKRKWLGERQRFGIFNKADIFEIAGEEGLKDFIEVLERRVPGQDKAT